jgi:hypothetical protein
MRNRRVLRIVARDGDAKISLWLSAPATLTPTFAHAERGRPVRCVPVKGSLTLRGRASSITARDWRQAPTG